MSCAWTVATCQLSVLELVPVPVLAQEPELELELREHLEQQPWAPVPGRELQMVWAWVGERVAAAAR